MNKYIVNQTDQRAVISRDQNEIELPINVHTNLYLDLMWVSCPLGYSLINDSCQISSITIFDWVYAHAQVADFNAQIQPIVNTSLFYQDWRIPNIKELTTLYRHESCSISVDTTDLNPYRLSLPEVQGEVVEWYWSSSPVSGSPDKAWSVNIKTGEVKAILKSTPLRVILLRNILPERGLL